MAYYKVTKHYISWILSCLLIYISNINKIKKISLLTLVDYCVSFCICIYYWLQTLTIIDIIYCLINEISCISDISCWQAIACLYIEALRKLRVIRTGTFTMLYCKINQLIIIIFI